MLKSTNPNTSPIEIRKAFIRDDDHELSNSSLKEKDLQVDYEHDQWWITYLPTGAQWGVHDTENGFCFEQVSEGEE